MARGAVEKTVAELRGLPADRRPDLILVAAHEGLGSEPKTGLDAKLGRVEDSALIDAIQTVQHFYSKADVSFASLFNTRVTVPKGPVTVRQIAALYLYDNELFAIEGDGKMVKDALENAARYFLSCRGETCSKGPLINSHI